MLECGGREVRPRNDLAFSVGESAKLLVEKLHGEVQEVTVQLSMPRLKKHPVTAPQAVTTEGLSDEIGLLRVAMFLGAIGIDVAKDIDHGVAYLNGCSRLIVDLRGNTGGDRRTSPHELSDAQKTQGWLQSHTQTSERGYHR